jgi:hypothetical protein
VNPQPNELIKFNITFLQWYCNPLEIAIFRTMTVFVSMLLAVGVFAALFSKAWTQAALMGALGAIIVISSLRMFWQILKSLGKNGVTLYLRKESDFIEIGNCPSELIRLNRDALMQRRGILGMDVIKTMGNCNLVIPRNCLW